MKEKFMAKFKRVQSYSMIIELVAPGKLDFWDSFHSNLFAKSDRKYSISNADRLTFSTDSLESWILCIFSQSETLQL